MNNCQVGEDQNCFLWHVIGNGYLLYIFVWDNALDINQSYAYIAFQQKKLTKWFTRWWWWLPVLKGSQICTINIHLNSPSLASFPVTNLSHQPRSPDMCLHRGRARWKAERQLGSRPEKESHLCPLPIGSANMTTEMRCILVNQLLV